MLREGLAAWIGQADAHEHRALFEPPFHRERLDAAPFLSRTDDYYISLVGEMFERLRTEVEAGPEWARLGNAFAQLAIRSSEEHVAAFGISRRESTLFAAAAFYFGGFPASAHLTMLTRSESEFDGLDRSSFELLARPRKLSSALGRDLLVALRIGDLGTISSALVQAKGRSVAALDLGPEPWISARLHEKLIERFVGTNIRAILPDEGPGFWDPFVTSLLDRRTPTWDFFPSQIDAIRGGLLGSGSSFALQMPTGAGKTALCETLLYWHATRAPFDVAILLVPYRSLASELRGSVVRRLNALGISSRCAYGGSVPTGDEVRGLDEVRVVIATPESLSGVLGADAAFFNRISLAICDEGHLLDGGARGVGLELLLARLRSRMSGPPRFVFVSAIVPNIEEINAWLGGSDASVVRSDYRPAQAEFAVLRAGGTGVEKEIGMEMHPHESEPTRYTIDAFLSKADFQSVNPASGRIRTYPFTSVKTMAIAAARKAMSMGSVAVFAANKRGNQGAIGLAEELLEQLTRPLRLPTPASFMDGAAVLDAHEYLRLEFGALWLGTQAVAAGFILHHGDLPQEAREVLEQMLRERQVRCAICTSTLAEGVNLPIRTLVLYSIERRQARGPAEPMLARDIKNLAGRAGRAGSTTKGLVICANERQWPSVEPVAAARPGEPVRGALRKLMDELWAALALRSQELTNAVLERTPRLQSLVDGIDATLIEFAAEEIGEEALVAQAVRLADQTFAAVQAVPTSITLLQRVFALRARRVYGIRAAGRLGWLRETGARARILDAVEHGLLPRRQDWDTISDPVSPDIASTLLDWAWDQPDVLAAVRDGFRLRDEQPTTSTRASLNVIVAAWLAGDRFASIAQTVDLTVDDLLGVHTSVVTFVLQTLFEQGIPLLSKLLESQGRALAPAVEVFPEHLRFGVPSTPARLLAAGGLRHRSAAVMLGTAISRADVVQDEDSVRAIARSSLLAQRTSWEARLGRLVVANSLEDLEPRSEMD